MQIVIPMSGFGERFRAAGYSVPKPLIEIEGKTMVEHVIDLFPGETAFTFVCNAEHLADPAYRMREILTRACPTGSIVGIPAHKLGPVHAVLQVVEQLDPGEPTIVNYCDFTSWWQYDDFKRFVRETQCDGAIPAYRGFHPHSLRGGVYAFIREQGLWAYDIREKVPFTDTPMQEFASSGTYYFRTAALMERAMRTCIAQGLDVRGEYYASMVYKPMVDSGLRVAVYELEHFMQWGTPGDVEDYLAYSRVFHGLCEPKRTAHQDGTILVPAVGEGRRFTVEGYDKPKPLVPVSGRPMILQAASDLPTAPRCVFVLRRDLPRAEEIASEIAEQRPSAEIVWLPQLTDGQARTCALALPELDAALPVTIGACDNGMLYSALAFERLMNDPEIDVVVWGFRGHPDAARRPHLFGWIDADTEGRVRGISVKAALPAGDVKRDPIVVGAFTFKRALDYARAFKLLTARDGRVNGELYVDSLINDAVDLGLRVALFEIQGYPGWGTPDDLRVFEYWQSCFHKWPAHPYQLEKDAHVPTEKVAELDRCFRSFLARRPTAATSQNDWNSQ